MEALEVYNALRDSLLSDEILPQMQKASLVTEHAAIADENELKKWLVQFAQAQGWANYRDMFHSGKPLSERTDLLEAQWHYENKTLQIKHVGNKHYHVNVSEQREGDTHGLQRQHLLTRDNQVAAYNIWWQYVDTGPQAGMWKPVYQQFIGYVQGGSQHV